MAVTTGAPVALPVKVKLLNAFEVLAPAGVVTTTGNVPAAWFGVLTVIWVSLTTVAQRPSRQS